MAPPRPHPPTGPSVPAGSASAICRPVFATSSPTISAAIGSRMGYPRRLPTMPTNTTSEEPRRIGHASVRDQQARFDALGDLQHVPKEKFLGDQRGGRHPQRGDLDVRDGARRFELADRRQQHGDAHRDSRAPSARDAAVSKRWCPYG